MKLPAKFIRNYKIGISDSDFTGKIKLSAVFNYFQEVASTHATLLGAGFDELKINGNITWVLVKMHVSIEKYPVWEDEVIVETWPLPAKGIQFIRDFLMKDSSGEIIIRGTSSWVVVDVITHELKRPGAFLFDYSGSISERAIDTIFKKINPTGDKIHSHDVKIGCSQIDMNGHLNNSKYIDFIMDCFNMDQLRKHSARSIQISYVTEAFAGDTIKLYKYQSPGDSKIIFVEGINEIESKTIFTASIQVSY